MYISCRALFLLEGDKTSCGSDEDFAAGGAGDAACFVVTIDRPFQSVAICQEGYIALWVFAHQCQASSVCGYPNVALSVALHIIDAVAREGVLVGFIEAEMAHGVVGVQIQTVAVSAYPHSFLHVLIDGINT